MVLLTGDEAQELRSRFADLNAPFLYTAGSDVYVDATELNAWRASQNTSKGDERG